MLQLKKQASIFAKCSLPTYNKVPKTAEEKEESAEFFHKVSEVLNHPAWRGESDEKTALTLLQDEVSMSYLLRQDSAGKYEYWLSYKDFDGTIRHRHFTIKMSAKGWRFVNFQAPAQKELSDFIQGALLCKEWN